MLLSNILFVIIFMATASPAAQYETSEKEYQEDVRILGTFQKKEQFEPFAWETVTTTIISDDRVFAELHRQYPYPEIASDEKPEVLGQRGMGFRGVIRKNADDGFLHISHLNDCVGVVLNGNTYSGAYHVSFMDLREFYRPQELNKKGNFAKWLDEYKATEINFSQARVFIASSFWTQNVDDVITILKDRGLDVHHMSIPDLKLVSTDANREVFISSTSPYLGRILALQGAMISLSTQLAVHIQTGEAWCEHFFRER